MKRAFHLLLAMLLLLTTGLAADDKPPELAPQIVIVGQGVRQGTVPYREAMTITTAIMKAGGISSFSAANVFLIRNAKTTKVPLKELIQQENREKDLSLQPWDIIYIQ